ncbi:phospho-sugar mutase [Corynebacterium pseudotuberculosis]|uniref:phospho-sugar mutase n=1 Tax=Corynebacterium pseudotuberculosis TaxID=1719 RepID=UPI0001DD466E|nr:phospho-sugar mutase [Corynebacterium pseudotuberculosis]ADK27958.1 phospho-sugar mutase [Corynebacterium pseudotuberculosis FRC41]ADL20067.1 phospho-sugar mutase [Corynebacterium pseudotuberculosis 1002]AEX38639.1 Phosphoglucosamine mutase [Corynebacterium pseudotuberculosis 3/99-5]AIG06523.1 Putative mutase [Corynebacterium pseudotuberculosis]AIG08895.1 Putative mutase [Corynebacterium pseudotuberculosis]
MTNTVIDRARVWAEHDPNQESREQIEAWIASYDESSLARAFAGPLHFGTAGLRAQVGPGESQLNEATILRTTAGLMAWLLEKLGQESVPRVVIGCDARHGSSEFYDVAAEVVSAAGGEALVLPKQNPTPLTAYTVKALGADAGIMITASHNPPADNGYKVYLGGRIATGDAEGVQLIAPADAEIAVAIASAPFADQIARNRDNIREIDTRERYIERAVGLAGAEISAETRGNVRIALTAMHGVGAALGKEILEKAGFEVSLVPEQAEPDADFPTVSFPNPEEKGALDLAKAHANAIEADVIIAYDPDADRCAVATKDDNAEGGWRQLSGDETGALLGEYLGATATGSYANSVVSGRLLAQVAKAHGLKHAQTLTGFKWIARTPNLAFGYEEAIGYCCDPEAVADKDGISASVVVASLVAKLKSEGRTLDCALDDLAKTHGLYMTAPLTFRVEDLSIIAEGMKALRTTPPTELAGSKVIEVVDLAEGTLGFGPTDGMMFLTEDDDRVICRPSGTEPKLKCYLEVVRPVGEAGVDRQGARDRLAMIAEDVRKVLNM